MQPATTVPRTQPSHDANLTSSHWDLRRKIALEQLRNTTASYLSNATQRRPHTPARTTVTAPEAPAAAPAKLGKPIGVAEPPRRRHRLLSPLTAPPIFRRRSYTTQAMASAQALDLPMSGQFAHAAQASEADEPKHSIVSIKRVMVFSTAVVVLFTLLYWLSDGVASSVPNETVQLKEHFFFSLRSFLTASSFDLAPINTLGRLFYSIEGVVGMMTMIIVSIVVSEKVAKV